MDSPSIDDDLSQAVVHAFRSPNMEMSAVDDASSSAGSEPPLPGEDLDRAGESLSLRSDGDYAPEDDAPEDDGGDDAPEDDAPEDGLDGEGEDEWVDDNDMGYLLEPISEEEFLEIEERFSKIFSVYREETTAQSPLSPTPSRDPCVGSFSMDDGLDEDPPLADFSFISDASMKESKGHEYKAKQTARGNSATINAPQNDQKKNKKKRNKKGKNHQQSTESVGEVNQQETEELSSPARSGEKESSHHEELGYDGMDMDLDMVALEFERTVINEESAGAQKNRRKKRKPRRGKNAKDTSAKEEEGDNAERDEPATPRSSPTRILPQLSGEDSTLPSPPTPPTTPVQHKNQAGKKKNRKGRKSGNLVAGPLAEPSPAKLTTPPNSPVVSRQAAKGNTDVAPITPSTTPVVDNKMTPGSNKARNKGKKTIAIGTVDSASKPAAEHASKPSKPAAEHASKPSKPAAEHASKQAAEHLETPGAPTPITKNNTSSKKTGSGKKEKYGSKKKNNNSGVKPTSDLAAGSFSPSLDGLMRSGGSVGNVGFSSGECPAVEEQHHSSGVLGQKKYKGVDGDHHYFDLKVIFDPFRTGFEEEKHFNPPQGSIIVGRYEVCETLGQAAFSTAYQCLDLEASPDDHPWVCLKVIKNSKDFFDQSLDEIKLLQYINSKGDPHKNNVLRMIDFFYCKEHLFIVSELLRENLYDFGKYIRDSGAEPYFTRNRMKKIMQQVLEALVYIQSLGLIHCDIKPENIVIKSYSRCEVKLIDFGSSCFVTDHLTTYIQSRSYRAPEVILGMPYDFRIDVWSLGGVLAEMLTGYVLFQNDSIATMLARIAGILGPFPETLMQNQVECGKYFVGGSNIVYECNTEGYFIVHPKKSNIRQRLHVYSDPSEFGDSEDDLYVDFVLRMLELDPYKRWNAVDALAHPWLRDVDELDVSYVANNA